MLAIELRFPAGRYHATPWNHHVNEGVTEWPPSPWRIGRALLAVWYLKAQDTSDASTVSGILEQLALHRPEYHVPLGATVAHTRHYMPIGELKSGIERTTKVFDTFVHTSSTEPLVVYWPTIDLSDEQRTALSLLLERLGYLGRAESWVEACLLDSAPDSETPGPSHCRVVPLNEDGELEEGYELFRLLCPQTSSEIAAWSARSFEEQCARRLLEKRERAKQRDKDPDKEKLSKKDKEKIGAALPKDLFEALQVETGVLKKEGWSGVPGAHWVDYVRPRSLLSTKQASTLKRSTQALPNTARFAVASQVPPRLTESLSFTEKTRAALMSRTDGHRVFSGKESSESPLSGHQHAFILPEANSRHGHISHVTIHAPMCFDDSARGAFDTLHKVWGHGGHDVQLILLGLGRPEDFAGFNAEAGQSPLLVTSRVWESRSPFVPTRHPKSKLDVTGLQVGCAEHDLRRLLNEQGYPKPESIVRTESTTLGGKATRWLQFRTLRKKGNGSRGANRGFGFRITFSRPVTGPIALGYGAHFGLGVFVGIEEQD